MMHNPTPAPETRAQRSAATREHIYKVGRQLIRQYGFDGVTIKMITQAAGVSVGSFYHFFGSKERLLDEISDSINQVFSIPPDIDYEHDDCQERILSFYKGFCELMATRSPDDMIDTFFGKRGNKTLLIDDRNYRKYMKEMLTGFQRAGKLRAELSIAEVEESIMVCFFGVVYHWATCDFSYPLYDKIRCVLGLFLRGCLSHKTEEDQRRP